MIIKYAVKPSLLFVTRARHQNIEEKRRGSGKMADERERERF